MEPTPMANTLRISSTSTIIKTPKSAPGGRYSTSRLDELAAPRPSSLRKKQVRSKSNQNAELVNDTPTSNSRNQHCQYNEEKKSSIVKHEIAPKINNWLPNVSDTDTILSVAEKSKKGWFNHDVWDVFYSDSDDDSDYESSHISLVRMLKKRVEELTTTLDSKDRDILKLEAQLREEKDVQFEERKSQPRYSEISSSNVTRQEHSNTQTDTAETERSEENSKATFGSGNNECLCTGEYNAANIGTVTPASLDCFTSDLSLNAFMQNFSGNMDSKLLEVDRMRLEHELEIEVIRNRSDSELFRKEERIISISASNERYRAQVESLAATLAGLQEECAGLRLAFQNAAIGLAENCSCIIEYVREELYSHPDNDFRAENEALRLELELTRIENSELKTELLRVKDELDGIANTVGKTKSSQIVAMTPKLEEKMLIMSPLPTFESWANFCSRFRDVIEGNQNAHKFQRRKVILNNNGKTRADKLFQELCFAREGTPPTSTEDLPDKSETDEIFIDASS